MAHLEKNIFNKNIRKFRFRLYLYLYYQFNLSRRLPVDDNGTLHDNSVDILKRLCKQNNDYLCLIKVLM